MNFTREKCPGIEKKYLFLFTCILDRNIENAILYFFKTIALSSRVIKVCGTTIRRILRKQNACLSCEENSNDM